MVTPVQYVICSGLCLFGFLVCRFAMDPGIKELSAKGENRRTYYGKHTVHILVSSGGALLRSLGLRSLPVRETVIRENVKGP